jgi:hypothetical protein
MDKQTTQTLESIRTNLGVIEAFIKNAKAQTIAEITSKVEASNDVNMIAAWNTVLDFLNK